MSARPRNCVPTTLCRQHGASLAMRGNRLSRPPSNRSPKLPQTTSTAMPAAPRSGIVSLHVLASRMSRRAFCAIFRRGGRNSDQRRIVARSSGGRTGIAPTPTDQHPALRSGTECWPVASCVASPFGVFGPNRQICLATHIWRFGPKPQTVGRRDRIVAVNVVPRKGLFAGRAIYDC